MNRTGIVIAVGNPNVTVVVVKDREGKVVMFVGGIYLLLAQEFSLISLNFEEQKFHTSSRHETGKAALSTPLTKSSIYLAPAKHMCMDNFFH
mgnify:CR=1 FL=1